MSGRKGEGARVLRVVGRDGLRGILRVAVEHEDAERDGNRGSGSVGGHFPEGREGRVMDMRAGGVEEVGKCGVWSLVGLILQVFSESRKLLLETATVPRKW